MKLCLVQNGEMEKDFFDGWFAVLQPSFVKVLRPDTEVVMKGLRGGGLRDNPLDYDHPYFKLLNKRPIIEAIMEAEKEGFDAAWVNCFHDSGVQEARSVVSIPVFGPAESTMHFACQLGRKFAVITANMPCEVPAVEEQIKSYGLEDRVIPNGVRMDKHPMVETFQKGPQDPKFVADAIAEVASRCVADGADVVIVGCCAISPWCTIAGLNKITVAGQDVPILDPITVVAKTAEMAVDIRRATGLPIPSRARGYALPPKEDLIRVRSLFGLSA